ncbi:MAG: hypothetical protein DMG22_05275 [Acidobacteria bacterium]|nr:MAG: hypothetical protein DMG22_05275 [Acidobacteriota bacterium]
MLMIGTGFGEKSGPRVTSSLFRASAGTHSVRHTFSTYGGNSGVPLSVLQSLLGHTSMETTMIYTHPLLEAERKVVEQIASILLPFAPTMASVRCGGKQ